MQSHIALHTCVYMTPILHVHTHPHKIKILAIVPYT